MSSIWFQFAIIVLLILANGFFSASEIAVVSARRGRLVQRAGQGSPGARTALRLAEEPNRFLATVQVGISLIGTFAAAFGGDVLAEPLGAAIAPFTGARYAEPIALALVVLLITYLSLILGELVPKRLALQRAEAIAEAIAPTMHLISRVAAPVVWFLTISTQAVLRLLGRATAEEEPVSEEDVLSLVREGTEAGAFETAEQDLIRRIFDFTDCDARSIMTPRPEIVAVAAETPVAEVVERVIESGFSRIPVFRGSLDQIVGIVYAKDLLRTAQHPAGGSAAGLADLLRPAVFVPEHQPLAAVLQHFRQTQTHLALVVDEYGQVDGLVTLEDVLEELTGEIADEYDEAGAMVTQRPDGSYLVDGLLSYADAEEQIGLPRRSEAADAHGFDTVAGLLLTLLEHIPVAGETVTWRGWSFEVVDMDGVRIDKVLARPPRVDAQTQDEGALAMRAAIPPESSGGDRPAEDAG